LRIWPPGKEVSFSGSAKFVDYAVSVVYCNVQYNYAQRIASPGAEHRAKARILDGQQSVAASGESTYGDEDSNG
jgi:hypothetical protein